jgi:hypothetical protein
MISAGQIAEILSLYERHGWILRRVLLSSKLKNHLADSLEKLFGEAQIVSSDIDAMWFSRLKRNHQESWELRRLSEIPYALLAVFDAEEEEEKIREETLREIELKMKNAGV